MSTHRSVAPSRAENTQGAAKHTPAAFELTFSAEGVFAAMYEAERWLERHGFSVGHSQRGAPRGVLLGDYDIRKWRNLSNADRRELDGVLTGDGRNGPLTLRLHTPEAIAKAQGPQS